VAWVAAGRMLAGPRTGVETGSVGDEDQMPAVPGAEPPRDPAELQGLAVLLHQVSADQRGLLDELERTLGRAWPEAVRIQRDGMFNRGRVNHIEVLLGGQVFDLRVEHGQVVASRGDVVGGVALSRTPCAIDGWVDGLLGALAEAARSSDAVRAALSQLT